MPTEAYGKQRVCLYRPCSRRVSMTQLCPELSAPRREAYATELMLYECLSKTLKIIVIQFSFGIRPAHRIDDAAPLQILECSGTQPQPAL